MLQVHCWKQFPAQQNAQQTRDLAGWRFRLPWTLQTMHSYKLSLMRIAKAQFAVNLSKSTTITSVTGRTSTYLLPSSQWLDSAYRLCSGRPHSASEDPMVPNLIHLLSSLITSCLPSLWWAASQSFSSTTLSQCGRISKTLLSSIRCSSKTKPNTVSLAQIYSLEASRNSPTSFGYWQISNSGWRLWSWWSFPFHFVSTAVYTPRKKFTIWIASTGLTTQADILARLTSTKHQFLSATFISHSCSSDSSSSHLRSLSSVQLMTTFTESAFAKLLDSSTVSLSR